MVKTIQALVAADLARAEAVLFDAQQKATHGPTVEHFRGEALALRRVLGMLEMEKSSSRGVMRIHRQYTLTVPWPAIFALLTFLIGLAL